VTDRRTRCRSKDRALYAIRRAGKNRDMSQNINMIIDQRAILGPSNTFNDLDAIRCAGKNRDMSQNINMINVQY